MTELYQWSGPNAVAFVLAWLLPLAGSTNKLGPERWEAGGPLPYRMVTRVAGPRTLDSDYPTIRVHTFGSDYTEAAREADKTDARMMLLGDCQSLDVTMSDGSLANCDWLEVSEAAHEEPYAAKSVVTRFVSEYRLGLSLSLVAAP